MPSLIGWDRNNLKLSFGYFMIKRFTLFLLELKASVLSICYGFALPVKYRSSWLLRGRPLIIKRRKSKITIGERFTACSQIKYNSLGVFQRVLIRTCTHEAVIQIGNNVGMSGCTVSAHRSVIIGNYVLIGSGALITDSDAHALEAIERRCGKGGQSKPVMIHDDVFIGARAIVLKGVTIGQGAIVGAGSVVVKDVPPFTVVAGNPARIVNTLKETIK